MTDQVFIALAGLVLLLSIPLFLSHRRRQQELEQILQIIQRANQGNLNARVLTQGQGKEGEVAFALNQLIHTLQQLTVEQRQWQQARKRLMSNISHDVRTPLTSIMGYVQALQDRVVTSDQERQEYLEIVAAKTYSLKNLLEDMFHQAKLDAKEVEMDFIQVDLNEVIRSCVISFLPQIKEAQLELQLNIPEEPSHIQAHYQSLERVFNNILRNALQHGRGGEKLGIEVIWEPQEQAYQVEIWDQGPGIPQEQLGKIFERLFRGDDSRKRVGDSSGLGLSISKELVEYHGGKIAVTSIPHQRTSFRVQLPVKQDLRIN